MILSESLRRRPASNGKHACRSAAIGVTGATNLAARLFEQSKSFLLMESTMQTKDAIKLALASTRDLLTGYLGDLGDNDLLVCPVPGANHIAWQLGHLIASEKHLLKSSLPGADYPELPADLEKQASGKSATDGKPGGFTSKAGYLDHFNKVRSATIVAVDKLADKDFDRPYDGELKAFAPTLGALLILVANHTLMHGGQFTVTRRALKKPVLF